MMPNANDLVAFIEVTSTGNLSRAAERLGVTQPALSQAMKRLEQAMDTQLLLRSKSGVVPTRAGNKLLAEARQLLEQWERLVTDSQKENVHVSGTYRLGLHTSVALYTLSHFGGGLMKSFPELSLQLEHDLSRRITERVVSFQLDFGIVVNPVSHPDLVIKEIFKDTVGFYQLKKIPKCNENILISDPDLIQTQELMRNTKGKKNPFERTIFSSSLEVIKGLILNGAGVGVIPERVLGEDIKKVKRREEFPIFKDRICMVYRHDFQKSQAARSLSASLIDYLKGLE